MSKWKSFVANPAPQDDKPGRELNCTHYLRSFDSQSEIDIIQRTWFRLFSSSPISPDVELYLKSGTKGLHCSTSAAAELGAHPRLHIAAVSFLPSFSRQQSRTTFGEDK